MRERLYVKHQKATLRQICRFNHKRILFCRAKPHKFMEQRSDRVSSSQRKRFVCLYCVTADDLILNQSVIAFQRICKGVERRKHLIEDVRLYIGSVSLYRVDHICLFKQGQRSAHRCTAYLMCRAQAFFTWQRCVFRIFSTLNIMLDLLVNINVQCIASHINSPFFGHELSITNIRFYFNTRTKKWLVFSEQQKLDTTARSCIHKRGIQLPIFGLNFKNARHKQRVSVHYD